MPTGSIVLHCDPTASHYLKLLMDAVFSARGFRNEIIWHYDYGARGKRTFGTKHDVIFWYSKSPQEWTFNAGAVLEPYKSKMTEWRYTRGGQAGKPMPAGKIPSDVWDFKINAMANEHLGYPTQKPLALMERIVAACSNRDDTVLDPFCGCGTTIAAAQHLGRHWRGIDVTHLAIGLIKHRLVEAYGPGITSSYQVIGEPKDVDGARDLALRDPFQFQAWALGLVGARIASSAKKGGDKGIDGRLYFHDESASGKTKQIIFSVKAGHLVPTYVRDLRGVLDREEAQVGVLLSFETPTGGMRAEAASAGFYDSSWGSRHQRIQLLTVGELLDGKQIDYPHLTGGNVTHRRAPRADLKAADQGELGYGNPPPPR